MSIEINPVSLLIGFIAGVSIFGLYLEFKKMKNEIKEIKQDQVKALPHGTLATLEDIHAICNDVQFQSLEEEKIIKSLMLSQAMRSYQNDAFSRIKELVSDIQQTPRKYKERTSRKRNIV